MKAFLGLLLVALMSLSVLARSYSIPAPSPSPSRPKYIECVDSSECNSWECCQLGMGRFSLPKCAPRPDAGQVCRPGGPINSTVFYPDGEVVQLSSVYLVLCPCSTGLECDGHSLSCHDPSAHSEFNLL